MRVLKTKGGTISLNGQTLRFAGDGFDASIPLQSSIGLLLERLARATPSERGPAAAVFKSRTSIKA